jgi:hypothetical protein
MTIDCVPTIVDYVTVLQRMTELGMRSLYYNSGAFGPADVSSMRFTGWIGPDDPTIRAEALGQARSISAPYEQNLAVMVAKAWREVLSGPAWVMPKSSWAYELDFGSKSWMPELLAKIGIDSTQLAPLTNAAAIEFMPEESDSFLKFITTLLQKLFGSDFAIAWPQFPVTCTVHHHKQIWWMSGDEKIIDQLRRIAIRNDS